MLLPLVLPIFFELLFTMLTGIVDTFMLATVGDQAVGAVGTANSYISVFLMMFTIISSGMLAVMTQYIGAKRPAVAQQTLRLGFLVNLIIGLLITSLLFFCAQSILDIVGVAKALREPARIYMQTVGAFCIFSALTPVYSSYLRAFGHTSVTLKATVFANIVNVALNALFLFVLDMGVFGVALATGISRLMNFIWVWLAAHRKVEHFPKEDLLKSAEILKKILQVGLPGALESSLYNLSVMIIISLLNRMDSTGTQAIARAYTAQISDFSLCASLALAQANAIIVGWRIGAGEFEICDRETRRNGFIGIALSGCTAGIFALFAHSILHLFTNDPIIISLVSTLLFVDIVLEIGRAVNLVYGNALKATGDAAYPMLIGLVFMFLCAVGGTWYFGVRLGWLAVGAYVGMTLDECSRAVCMFLRWNKGIWKKKNLVS